MANKYDNEFERLKRLNRIRLFKSKFMLENQMQGRLFQQTSKNKSLDIKKVIAFDYMVSSY